MVIESELPLTRYISPPLQPVSLLPIFERVKGGAFVVGKPVTTLQRNKKNMFNFIEVGLNLDIKFCITVEHKANLKQYFALRAQICRSEDI